MEIVTTAAILQALPDPVLLIDSQKTIVTANEAAKNLMGVEIEGRSLALALRQPEVLDAVNDVLRGEDQQSARISLFMSVRRIFDIQVAALEAATQSDARAVLIMHDMTAAQNAEQMRADFVANVSHELRSPLSALVSFIETLRGPARDDPSVHDRFLDIMDSESKRMARLIDDLLSLSRVEANEHVLPDGQVELRALLADVTNTLSARANSRFITISFVRDGASVFTNGDWDELTEVFHNLIDNAVKYCPEHTTVRVEIDKIQRIPEIGLPGVVIAITDEGDGIPAEHLPRLTERFYRVDKGRSRTMGGTGLGLAIVKHIVNRHRGRLTVDSALGQGTVFKVFLPSVRDMAEPDDLSQY